MNTTEAGRTGLATIREAAEFLKMSRSHVYELLDAGRIRYARLPGKGERCSRRIPWAELDRFVESSMTTAPTG